MKKFLSLIIEEFQHFIKDKGAVLIMVLGITAYAFTYVLPYYKEVVRDIPVGMVDLDQSSFSRNFTRNMEITDVLDMTNEFSSINEAEKEFYKDHIKGFIVIPRDFEKNILRGKQTNVILYGDSAYLIIYKTIYSSLLQTAIETGAKIEIAKMMKTGIPKKQAIVMKQPFQFVQIPLFNPVGGYKSYIYPIILILIFHQTLVLGLSLMQGTRNEKKELYAHTEKDIPITIFAKSTMYVFLYLFYGLIGFLIFPNIFNYPINYNFIPLIIIYLLMMYSAAFFAQTISYFFKYRECAILFLVACSILFMFIPGFIWPRESIPAIINIISFFIPATCGIDGIVKINQNGASYLNILYDYTWLIFLCIFYFILANLTTKKMDTKVRENE